MIPDQLLIDVSIVSGIKSSRGFHHLEYDTLFMAAGNLSKSFSMLRVILYRPVIFVDAGFIHEID